MLSILAAVAISGCCRPLLQSLANTFFELSVVENPRFAVRVSKMSFIVVEIKSISAFGSHFRLSVITKMPRDAF